MLDIKKCEVIITIAEENNLTRAAEKLGYTQPGISNIIRKIEEETGFPLFHRHHNGMTPTKETERLLPQIKKILANHRSIEETVSSINGIHEGHITIGSYSSMSITYLASWIESFVKQYPNITFSIVEGGYRDLEEGLNSFRIDMALMSRQPWHNYAWTPVLNDELYAILPADSNFPRDTVTFSDFDNIPLIYHEKGSDPDVERILSNLAAKGILPDYKYCISFDRTMMSMIEHHLGYGILSELIFRYYHGKLKCIPFDPPIYRELGIATRGDILHSPAVELFIEHCHGINQQNNHNF